MHTTPRNFAWLAVRTSLLAVLALVALFASSDHVSAATFNPNGTACLDNEDTPADCDGDSSPGAVTGAATSFNLPAPDANFSAVVSFLPPDFDVPKDADIPDGAIIAQLTSDDLNKMGSCITDAIQPVAGVKRTTTCLTLELG